MWESSLKGSEFCFNRNAISNQFRPCIDYIILPGIFLVYILLWYLIDADFFTVNFYRKCWFFVKNGVSKVVNIFKFFLSCFGSRDQLATTASTWNFDNEHEEKYQIPDSQKATNSNFINPKCGNCSECQQNPACPMKTWNELRRFRVWVKPFEIITSIVGFIALVFDIFLVLTPDNKPPNTNETDNSLKVLISIAPEWYIVTNLVMLAIISILIAALIGRQMNRVPVSDPK